MDWSDADRENAAANAPNEDEFRRLIEATNIADKASRVIEDKFIIYSAGRLTLRSGELLHLHEGWIDRRNKLIKIPNRDYCDCRYCWERADDIADGKEDVTIDDVIEEYWQPKYPASVRAIPYGFSETAIDIVETFVDDVGYLDMCQSTINRRVNTLEERSGICRVDLHPHALRAAAGFFWANLGLEPIYLLAIMGWNDLRVANRYIRATGRQLNNRVKHLAAHSHDDWFIDDPDRIPDPAEMVYSMDQNRNPRASTPKTNESSPTPNINKTTLADKRWEIADS
jgi:integrase